MEDKSKKFSGYTRGNMGNLLLGDVLRSSNYEVIPSGVEVRNPELCKDIAMGKIFEQIQERYGFEDFDKFLEEICHPDLKVIEPVIGLESLVEVKLNGISSQIQSPNFTTLSNTKLKVYKKYNALLVFAYTSKPDNYYCIKASEINPDMTVQYAFNAYGNNNYDLSGNIKPIEHYFDKIRKELILPSINLSFGIAKLFESILTPAETKKDDGFP